MIKLDISSMDIERVISIIPSRQPSRNRGTLANYSAVHEIFHASMEGASHYDRYTTVVRTESWRRTRADITPAPDNFSQETFRTQRRVGRVVSVEIPVVN